MQHGHLPRHPSPSQQHRPHAPARPLIVICTHHSGAVPAATDRRARLGCVQDTAFWPKLAPNAINFWLAIDPATAANGCIHLVPRSHHQELPHHDDPLHNHVLREEQADVARQVPIELEPGDALFFDSGIVSYSHAANPSRLAY